MPKGLALNIGLNSVNPDHYQGWSGPLNACEADALDMAGIGRSCGFKAKVLLTRKATRNAVLKALRDAAIKLRPGDIFLLSYSGHGGQLPDLNSDEETDAQDETWCLYNGELVDDEIFQALAKFAKGVRILVFSDSCHSGTVTKDLYYAAKTNHREARDAPPVSQGALPIRYRAMPPQVALRTYRANKTEYDKILKSIKADVMKDVKASVLLISGCQDNQLSADGDFNGLFTANLLRVWNEGQFKGSYKKFHRNIVKAMPPDQTPNFYIVGMTHKTFERQKPFTV
ncbi:MAG: caspase family protein [Candidatus Binatia bacterium]